MLLLVIEKGEQAANILHLPREVDSCIKAGDRIKKICTFGYEKN